MAADKRFLVGLRLGGMSVSLVFSGRAKAGICNPSSRSTPPPASRGRVEGDALPKGLENAVHTCSSLAKQLVRLCTQRRDARGLSPIPPFLPSARPDPPIVRLIAHYGRCQPMICVRLT